MLIFEGCDCAGKSTLAQAVAKILASRGKLGRFVRYGLLPPDWDYCRDYLLDVQPYTIADRFVASEFVYGKVLRDNVNERFTSLNQAVIAREMAFVCAMTVLVDPGWDVIEQRLMKRGDKLLTTAQVRQAHDAFNALISHFDKGATQTHWSMRNNILASTHFSAEDIADHYLQLQDDGSVNVTRSWDVDCHGPVSTECEAVFVGERPNDKLRYVKSIPRAFSQGKSAEYLHKVILQAGLDPAWTFMINAVQADGRMIERKHLNWAEEWRIPIIALGKVAADALDELDMRCIYADHPNYTRRFFHACDKEIAAWLATEIDRWHDES